MARNFVFHRPRLAARLADIALGTDPLGGESGLFLAAPRRTGKSTFLTSDLMPELVRRGAFPVYVDLWADRTRDPGDVIAERIRTEIQNSEAGILKIVRRSGMSKVGLGSWLAVDIDKIGRPGGATLADALAYLSNKTGSPVVLVVDEAQHASTSEAGVNAMFALKSARDTLNSGAGSTDQSKVRLGLVFTGSHRDKLASLVIGKSQPFFGASITDFPLLGREFTDDYTEFVNSKLAQDQQLDKTEVFEAFQTVAFRPELLQAAIKNYSIGNMGAASAPRSLTECAVSVRETYWAEFDSQWSVMSELQKAVLRRIIDQGDNYRPFDADALTAYSEDTGGQVLVADAQGALEMLREKGLVIRLERGRYTLDDPSLADWMADRFPPTGGSSFASVTRYAPICGPT